MPRVDATGMIMSNVENKVFASFTPAFLATTYSLPEKETSVTTKWVKILKLDYTTTTKMMVAEGNTFRHKQSAEYETAHLRTPFRIIALMLRRLYGRADGKLYNFGWISLMYYVAMEGRIFNWVDIVTRNLAKCIRAKCIRAAQEGLRQSKSEFYMSSFLIYYTLYCHRFKKLNFMWKGGKSRIYIAYQILGTHKYHSHYQLICEEFLRPLYQLIFLEECPCLSEGALESIREYGLLLLPRRYVYKNVWGNQSPLIDAQIRN